MTSASVPLATPAAGRPPSRSETAASSARPSGPRMKRPLSTTPAMAASISARSGPYWALMSIRGTGIRRRGTLSRPLGGEGDGDGRAEPLAGGGLGPAAKPFRDVLDDRQPEAGPPEPLRPRRVRAIEALEDMRQVALRDPGAVVGDRQRHDVALAAHRRGRGRPGARVLDRVLHEVADDR